LRAIANAAASLEGMAQEAAHEDGAAKEIKL
jgi:hypothetical protein